MATRSWWGAEVGRIYCEHGAPVTVACGICVLKESQTLKLENERLRAAVIAVAQCENVYSCKACGDIAREAVALTRAPGGA